jgi:hypothetical protein
MDRKSANGNRPKHTIAVITCILTLASLIVVTTYNTYRIYLSERGRISGKANLLYTFGNKIYIKNGVSGPGFNWDITLHNVGTGKADIKKIEMYIALKKGKAALWELKAHSIKVWYQQSFMPLGHIVIMPDSSWGGRVTFSEDVSEAIGEKATEMNIRIVREIQQKYIADFNEDNTTPQRKYDISDDLSKDIAELTHDHLKWLEKGDYRLLVPLQVLIFG